MTSEVAFLRRNVNKNLSFVCLFVSQFWFILSCLFVYLFSNSILFQQEHGGATAEPGDVDSAQVLNSHLPRKRQNGKK